MDPAEVLMSVEFVLREVVSERIEPASVERLRLPIFALRVPDI